MGKNEALIGKLKSFKEEVSRVLPIERMIFFGSRASGRAGRWSDIDLLVVSKKFRRVRPLKRGLVLFDHWALDYPVDFVCYTPEEFRRAKKMVGLASEALKSGITI